jgi:hypothetical protein
VDVKRFSSGQVLALGSKDELCSLLQASAVNLTECLRLFSGQPGVHFEQDESGVRFLNRNAPPDSMVLRMQPGAATVDEQIDEELLRFEAHGLPVDWMIYGTWLTRAALDEARHGGHRYASLMSSPLGYSVYRSLGFDLEFEIPEYRWTPRRPPEP